MALGQRIKSPSFDLNAEPLDSLDVDKMCLLWKNDICSHCAQFFVKMSSNLFQTRVFTMFAVCSSPTPHIPIKLYTRRPMKKSNPQNTPHTLLIRHINLILPPPRLQQASHSQYVVSWRAREPERKRERENAASECWRAMVKVELRCNARTPLHKLDWIAAMIAALESCDSTVYVQLAS